MDSAQTQRIRLHIGGMTCANCEARIQKQLSALAGVARADVSWKRATADVDYDARLVTREALCAEIAALGYTVRRAGAAGGAGKAGVSGIARSVARDCALLAVIVAAFLLLQRTGVANLLAPSRVADAKMGYGMLFVIGLLTSVHCVAMCGGINLSQSLPRGADSGASGKRGNVASGDTASTSRTAAVCGKVADAGNGAPESALDAVTGARASIGAGVTDGRSAGSSRTAAACGVVGTAGNNAPDSAFDAAATGARASIGAGVTDGRSAGTSRTAAACGVVGTAGNNAPDRALDAAATGARASVAAASATSRRGARGALRPALLYNAGRVAAYTAVGLALGAAGWAIGGAGGSAELPLAVQAALKLAAGALMVVMGVTMLGLFPALRSLVPSLPAPLAEKITRAREKQRGAFVVGVLNGFMPCGALQAMWVVALASAHPLAGALSMLSFALGTVPLILGLGSLVSLLGRKYTGVVMKTGAVLVAVMGLSMLSQGWALGGFGRGARGAPLAEKGQVAQAPAAKQAEKGIVMRDGKQIVTSTLTPYRYPTITVKKGVPVQWELTAPEGSLTGCNYKMLFQEFGFMYTLGYGKNVIEFTPERTGAIPYTCWMGMIRGTINVEE